MAHGPLRNKLHAPLPPPVAHGEARAKLPSMASAAAVPPDRRWIYGPLPDLLLGCGVWYMATFVALAVAGSEIRAGGAALALPFLTLVFGTPHYGATLLRVYERRDDRRAYAVFAVWATLGLAAAFAWGVHDALVGSVLLTTYLTWSPWHYTGQNYGIAVMFLRRRGVSLEGGVKRWLYLSFLLSFVLTFLAMHSGEQASHYAPLTYEGAGYHFLSLGLPSPWADAVFAGVALAYGIALGGAAIQLLRRGSARALLPAALLAATQALWFSVPLLVRRYALPLGLEPWTSAHGSYYFLWIAIGHSVQYVWITSFYARQSGGWSGLGPYVTKVMLAGAAVWTLPALVFAPNLLGRLPFDAGLGILVAAVVNLHHFVLDGAIWKLRDGRVSRVLLRPREEVAAEGEPVGRTRWLAPAIWATGAVCVGILFYAKWERDVGLPRALASGEVAEAQATLDRLGALGRDSGRLRAALGRAWLQRDRPAAAERELRRALELQPTLQTCYTLGNLYASQGRWREALEVYEKGLALDPDAELLHYRAGLAWLETGRPERAREAFARAAELNPERRINRTMLERAESAMREPGGSAPPS